jgi:asparaginyl-tRNA synthetase
MTPTSIKRVLIASLNNNPELGSEIKLAGWVRTRRDSKGVSFLELNDGTTQKGIQIVLGEDLLNQEEVAQINTGYAIEVVGELVASPGKEQSFEVKAEEIKVVGGCPQEEYPLQKKRHTLEFLRTIAHLRPRTNTHGAIFRVRSVAAFAVHRFFQERGFFNLHSPIITTADCEGAGQMFRVTTLDLENLPRNDQKKVDFSKDFFAAESSLTVSGQLEAECFACAMSNVYTFGPTFRAENSNTPRHLAEFWMIEPEMAFCDLAGDAEIAEDFVKYVISSVLEKCSAELAFFEQFYEKGLVESLQKVAASNFARMTYTEAIRVLESATEKFEFPVSWGMDIQTEHERYLSEKHVGRPVFVTNYPKEIKAFYMRLDEGEKTVSAMDLLVPRLGEIIGGSQREEREDVLRRRMTESGLDAESYWWYLELRRFGTVPHAGFGLGFERLIQYLTGIANIRDVMPFPRTPGSAQF